jgi:exosortase E/protease (VPEID-CTERM system)
MPSWSGRPVEGETIPPAAHLNAPYLASRFATVLVLIVGEVIFATALLDLPHGLTPWSNPAIFVKWLGRFSILAAISFALIAWPRREELLQTWRVSTWQHNWGAAVLANLCAFVLLVLASIALSDSNPQATEPYWFWGYSFLLVCTGASLALIAAPLSFWQNLVKTAPVEIFLALIGAGFILLAGELSKESWESLSAATMYLSHWILELYEANTFLDMQSKLLGAEDFRVRILADCSGYEGVGLIVAFLSIYLWVFRSHLKFPNALLLLPAGIIVIWILNSVRIAVLVSIGAHISPTIALTGFHSWAGWITLLVVTVGVMVAAPQTHYFWKSTGRQLDAADDSNDRYVFAFLAPFAALMAASIVASAFAPADQWLYSLKVVAVGITLWWFRDVYTSLTSTVSPVSVGTGLIIGVLWIATDPGLDAETPLGPWLAGLPASLAFLWLAIRALGSVVLVPIAEELAFRGYLYRALSFMRFEALGPVQFRWFALIASSLAFGILHERWLAATLAGAVYALLMYRSNKLADPIAAHMASNAAIVVWSISTEQWTLL